MEPITILCDIDGTLLKHEESLVKVMSGDPIEILDGSCSKLLDWHKKGYRVILITGRPESLRCSTEKQLAACGLLYDQLVMGLGPAPRVLINDMKPDGTLTGFGLSIERNMGIKQIDLEDLVFNQDLHDQFPKFEDRWNMVELNEKTRS